MLPANTLVEFHVTSLDAIHSFWAYQLGVKADANPGVDNIAFVKTKGPRSFEVRCAELCGLWHGYMFDTGRVVAGVAVRRLDQGAAGRLRAGREVPAEVLDHVPTPTRRGGPDEQSPAVLSASTC